MGRLPNVGVFYVVQLEPVNAPHRIKLGWALHPYRRLRGHRVSAPHARLLAFWRCPRTDEGETRRRLTVGCRRLPHSNEIYVVPNLQAFCEQFAQKLLRHALNEAYDVPLPYHWPD